MADSGRGVAADDLSSDDEPMDEDEQAAIAAAIRLQLTAQQPVPRQLPPPPQAPLLNKMTGGIQKKDKQEKDKTDADEDEEE